MVKVAHLSHQQGNDLGLSRKRYWLAVGARVADPDGSGFLSPNPSNGVVSFGAQTAPFVDEDPRKTTLVSPVAANVRGGKCEYGSFLPDHKFRYDRRRAYALRKARQNDHSPPATLRVLGTVLRPPGLHPARSLSWLSNALRRQSEGAVEALR